MEGLTGRAGAHRHETTHGVSYTPMRTNIDIDEALIERVMSRHGVSTKRAAVDLALRRLDLEPMTREEALAMEGSGWNGDLDELRDGWLPRAS
jgi:Arc/MetJ family transcription regulator